MFQRHIDDYLYAMAMINKNLKYLRGQQGMTQKQLAEKLGLKQAAIGAYEEERATPPLASLLDLSKIFNVNLDDLVRQDLSKGPEKKRQPLGRGREVLAITVDAHNRENVELVTQKASAGYMSGFQDVEFVKELPKISMPVLPRNKTYRAFEIQGDSMLPVLPGSIIFGEYVEAISTIKNGKLYILMTRQDGIVFKRIFNLSDDKGKLLLVSDNRQYAPYTVDAADVMEVWSAKAFFSNQFPEAQIAPAPVTDNMAHTIVQLQEEVSRLRKK